MSSTTMVRIGRVQDFLSSMVATSRILRSQLADESLQAAKQVIAGRLSQLDETIQKYAAHFDLDLEFLDERQPKKKGETIEKLRADGLDELADWVRDWRNSKGNHYGWDSAFVAKVGEDVARKYDIHTVPVGRR